ncbi:MAG: DUF4272 domain-containing protein [Planctomycetota bacterium]
MTEISKVHVEEADGEYRSRLAKLPPDYAQLDFPSRVSLPLHIDGSGQAMIRGVDDAARRTIALYAVTLCAQSHPGNDLFRRIVSLVPFGAAKRMRKKIRKWLHEIELWSALSPLEQAFVQDDCPGKGDLIDFSWRAESLHVFLWCLGLAEELPPPGEPCRADELWSRLPPIGFDAREFVRRASLRPGVEILAELEITFHERWHSKNAALKGLTLPVDMHPGILFERHYALNWLTSEQDWDDVTTDT